MCTAWSRSIESGGSIVTKGESRRAARRAISVTERQRYILRVRALSKAAAVAWYQSREALGFPLCQKGETA